MIDRDGATCRNNNHFEGSTILNAPWDAHSMMFFKSVADLSFTGPFAVLGFAKYQYRPLRASTDGRTLPTFDLDHEIWPWPWNVTLTVTLTLKQIQRPQNVIVNTFYYRVTLTFDLRPWPTIPAQLRSRSNPMPKIKVIGQTVQTGELGQTNRQTDRQSHGRYQTYYLPCFAVDNNLGGNTVYV